VLTDELEDLADGIGYARGIVVSHRPVNPGPGRTRCPICDTWHPCDLVSLAALAVLKDQERAAAEARADAAERALREANALVSGGICVVGAAGKDSYIRQIGSVLDRAILAAAAAAPPAAPSPDLAALGIEVGIPMRPNDEPPAPPQED